MAKDKKGFLLYSDLINVVSQLPDESAGKLFKIILTYVNDLDVQIDDLLLKIAFEPIKQQLKRDLKKFEEKKEQYSAAGKKSAEVKRLKKLKELEQNSTTLNDVEKRSTNSTVNDNVNVNDTVNVNDNIIKTKKVKTFSEDVLLTFDNCLNLFPESLQPEKEKQKLQWYDTIEKLNRIEKIPFDLIEKITKAARENDFWSKNFLSIVKLRKKNREGIMYVQVFYEQFKQKGKSKSELSATEKLAIALKNQENE